MAAEVSNFRPLPAARVVGDGSFRFPLTRGIGNFRPPLVQLDLPQASFSDQAAAEVPEIFSLRVNDIILFRGGTIDLTA